MKERRHGATVGMNLIKRGRMLLILLFLGACVSPQADVGDLYEAFWRAVDTADASLAQRTLQELREGPIDPHDEYAALRLEVHILTAMAQYAEAVRVMQNYEGEVEDASEFALARGLVAEMADLDGTDHFAQMWRLAESKPRGSLDEIEAGRLLYVAVILNRTDSELVAAVLESEVSDAPEILNHFRSLEAESRERLIFEAPVLFVAGYPWLAAQ